MRLRNSLFTALLGSAFLLQVDAEEDPAVLESQWLTDTRQLTFAGKRAGEGYFSADGSKLIFQSERDAENPFFQIYLMDMETGDVERLSPGHGKTTCAWVHPSGKRALYASTEADPDAVTKQKDEIEFRISGQERRYSWDYDEHFDIFEINLETEERKNLTDTLGYDAEGSYSPDGKWIVFASNRHAFSEGAAENESLLELKPSFFMDLYRMRSDGSEVSRLTNVDGYDGGPFFSADGEQICWRRFNEAGDRAEIMVMNADGSDQRAVTQLGALSWAPFFHPSGDYLIFASNLEGFANFELYLVDAAGQKEPVRVTYTDGFDGLPAFSPDGKQLTWTSNRTSDDKSQIFLASWDHQAALASLENAPFRSTDAETASDYDFTQTSDAITEEDLKFHVDYLASDELEGRLTGTQGEILATAYVADAFATFGLEPDGEGDSFFQPFEFTAGVDLGESNELTLVSEESEESFQIKEDWVPLSFSTTGTIEASEVVFAGYGIEVPEEQAADGTKREAYHSYTHLDVEDRWVLMFRYSPQDISPEENQRFARFSSLRHKAMTARERGARGILVVSGPNSRVNEELVPLSFDASLAGSGVAAISITDALAQRLLDAGDQDLKALQDKLDTGAMIAGITLPDVSLGAEIDIREEKKSGRNVIARLVAGDKASNEPAIIIGAHVDHLGKGAGGNSRARSGEENSIHYGADDNASGVASILEIAQYLASRKEEGKLDLKRDLIFAAWSGEELGLLGSSHYARAMATAAGDEDGKLGTHLGAALNLDMVGRLDKALVLQGIGSSDRWAAEIEQRNVPIGLPIVTQTDAYLPTDATSFYLRGVPILSAFTGAHDDYHTPRDTPDLLNYAGLKKVTDLMSGISRSLGVSESVPEYKEAPRPEREGGMARMRVFLGTVPDYSQGDVTGVKLSGVQKDGPADQAGVQAGDVIVKLAGKDIENIYDYTYVMGVLQVGEEAEIVVERKGETKALTITPGSRD